MNENNWNALGVIRLQHGQTGGAIVAIHPDRFHQPKEGRVRIISEWRREIRRQRTGRTRDPNGFAQGRIVQREDRFAGRLQSRRRPV